VIVYVATTKALAAGGSIEKWQHLIAVAQRLSVVDRQDARW
jgi:hypothetical protein